MGFSRQESWSGVPLPSPPFLLESMYFTVIKTCPFPLYILPPKRMYYEKRNGTCSNHQCSNWKVLHLFWRPVWPTFRFSPVLQICTLRGPASQKYSVPGKPGRLGALIQIPSLGKYVILREWRTRQIFTYLNFFWKAIADCLRSCYIQLQSFSLYFLPFLSSGPLDKLEACFSLVICHTSVFSFFWKRLSGKGTSSAWFSGDLFWLFCSLLIYFGSHIISARLSWRKYLITECQRRVPCRYFENSSVLPLSPAVSRAWCHRLGNPSLPGTVTLPTPSSD